MLGFKAPKGCVAWKDDFTVTVLHRALTEWDIQDIATEPGLTVALK